MVESLRRFDPASQRSVGPVDHVVVVPVRETFGAPAAMRTSQPAVSVLDFLSAAACAFLVSELDRCASRRSACAISSTPAMATPAAAAARTLPPPADGVRHAGTTSRSGSTGAPRLEELALGRVRTPAFAQVRCQPAWSSTAVSTSGWPTCGRRASVATPCSSSPRAPGRAERVVEILRDYDIVAVPVDRAEDAHAAAVLVAVGAVSRGFRLADAALQVYVERDVFDEERHAATSAPGVAKAFLSDLRDLKVGDLVVHVDHGIGEFVGLKQLGVSGSERRAGVPRAALSRRRQAVRAGRAARSDPEVHGRHRGRRSTGWAAPPGRRPSRASRRRCATWPRSC